jgi:hypothetical protein
MRSYFPVSAIATVVLMSVVLYGCGTTGYGVGTTINYSYEPRVNFSEFKTYQWPESKQTYARDPLVEANVRFVADRELASRGLTLKADQADLLIWIGSEFNIGSYSPPYELRTLTLNIARADNKQLVWRGTAIGAINTGATSDNLKTAVEGILANFPPK